MSVCLLTRDKKDVDPDGRGSGEEEGVVGRGKKIV